MIKDIHEVKTCPECGSNNITYNEKNLQVICKTCGLIFEPLTLEKEEKFEKAAGIKS